MRPPKTHRPLPRGAVFSYAQIQTEGATVTSDSVPLAPNDRNVP